MSFVVYELGEPHPWPERPARDTHGLEPTATAAPVGQAPRRPLGLRPRARTHDPRVGQSAYRKAKQSRETQRELALTAEQIMSKPVVTLPADATLNEAWELIRRRRFRHVPLVSHDKKLVGIISDRELLQAAAKIGNTTGDTTQETVGQLVEARVLTALPSAPIREIARTLFEERIGAMPVVENGTLVGIITRSDILRALVNHAGLELWI